jgi:hypothetical protein
MVALNHFFGKSFPQDVNITVTAANLKGRVGRRRGFKGTSYSL